MRILLVEDDLMVGAAVRKGLQQDGHSVDWIEDANAAAAALAAGAHELVLLDLGLPGKSGLALLGELRRAGNAIPIIVCTARDAIGDRVRGLDLGADDYLVKPFAFDELLARVRALGRRGRSRNLTALLRYGGIEVDQRDHQVRVEGQLVQLTATEYRLLEYLLRRAESIVSRDQLAEHVWGGDYDPFSNIADVYIGYLRRKLGPAAGHVQTIRGLGYMLKGPGR